MLKVVLAGTYPTGTYNKIKALLPEDQFDFVEVNDIDAYNAMTDAEIIILRIFKAPKEIIANNPNLKMILRWGAGFDSVDIEAAGKQGVLVTNTPGANAEAVSQLALLLMLAVGRKLYSHEASLKAGEWSKNTFLNESFTLAGKQVGIIGGGNIGRMVATKVQCFGSTVQYFDVFRLSEEMEQKFNLRFVPLEELIATSDVISLHVPLLDSTKHMISEEEIAKMKPGTIIINTARGGLVDDKALAAAVQAGKLGGAGLDVVEEEPLPVGHELLSHPNIVVTPHIGGGVADIGEVIIPMLVQDIKDYAAGKEVAHVVNKQYL